MQGLQLAEVASVDAGVGAAVDLTAGTADIDVGASVAAADVVTVDTSVAAAADLPAGTVDVGVDTSVAAGRPAGRRGRGRGG